MKNCADHFFNFSVARSGAMDIFSEILAIKGFTVIHIETSETELHLYLECESATGVCPHCGQTRHQAR
jgi:hypothetical protein